jgi:hypothetical protein
MRVTCPWFEDSLLYTLLYIRNILDPSTNLECGKFRCVTGQGEAEWYTIESTGHFDLPESRNDLSHRLVQHPALDISVIFLCGKIFTILVPLIIMIVFVRLVIGNFCYIVFV